MASKREISFLITGDAKSLAAAAQKAEAELQKLENFKLKAKELGINYDPQNLQDKLAKINELKLATKYAKVDADVKTAEADIQKFVDGTNAKTSKLSAIRMEIDRRHLDEQIAGAEKELAKLGTEAQQAFKLRMDKIGDSLTGIGKTMSIGVTAPIMAGFALATKASSDLGEAIDYTNRLLPEGSAQIHAFGETAAQAFGLSKVEVEKYSQSYATMLKGAGMSMEEVTKNSLELVKRTADIGSALNLTNDEVAAKLKSGLAGETEALRSIGVIIDEDAKKRYAWAHGIAEQGAQLTAQEKVLASFGLVMEKTSDQANNFGDTIGISMPNQMKAAKAAATNTAASFGESLKPVMAEVYGFAGKLTAGFNDLSEGQKKAIVITGGMVAALGPLLGGIGSVVKVVGGLDTAFNVFRNKQTIDGVTSLTGGLTKLGTAAAGLGIIGAVAGGFFLLNGYLRDVEQRKIAEKFAQIQTVLANPNALQGEIVKVAEAFKILDASLKQLGDRAKDKFNIAPGFDYGELIKSKKEIALFNDAIDQMLEKTGNTAGVKAIIAEMSKFKDSVPGVGAEIIALQKKVDDYSAALTKSQLEMEASRKFQEENLRIAKLEQKAYQDKTDAVKEYASQTVAALQNVMRTEEEREALAAKLTANEQARYKGRDADIKAMNDAMPAARKWVQEQLDADKKVADARTELDKVKAASYKDEKDALKKVADARKDAAAQYDKDIAHEKDVAEKGRDAVTKAEADKAEAVEKANDKMSEAAQKAIDILAAADDKIAKAEQDLVKVVHDGQDKIAAAKQKVVDATLEGDADILKASNAYQQQLVDNNRDITKSEEALAQVFIDTGHDIEDAEKDLRDTIRDSAQDVTDARKDMQDTAIDVSRNVSDAELDLARTIEDAAEKISDAKKAEAQSAEDSAQRILDAEARITGDRKSNAKSVGDAEKEATKTAKEGAKDVVGAKKDVTKAEADYATAVAKSGSGSDAAASAAERLQSTRDRLQETIDRVNENNEKAQERIRELQDKAAESDKKNTEDLAKVKKKADEDAVSQAEKVADAEREAARQITDANTKKDRAIQDGIAANQAAAEKYSQAEIKATDAVQAKEEELSRVRAKAATDRDKATADHKEVEDKAEQARIDKSNEVLDVITKNNAKIKGLQDAEQALKLQYDIDLTVSTSNLKTAVDARHTAEQEANKTMVEAQKQSLKDIAAAYATYKGVITQVMNDNKTAIDTTAEHAKTAAEKISGLLDTLDTVRINSADKIKAAEGGVTTALDDQKTKVGELKGEFEKFDVATQKAIRNQISLIKGGKIEGGGDAVTSSLEDALKDVIGDDTKGVMGVTKAVNDIPPLKTIDITVTINGKVQTFAEATGTIPGGTAGAGSADASGENPGQNSDIAVPGPNGIVITGTQGAGGGIALGGGAKSSTYMMDPKTGGTLFDSKGNPVVDPNASQPQVFNGATAGIGGPAPGTGATSAVPVGTSSSPSTSSVPVGTSSNDKPSENAILKTIRYTEHGGNTGASVYTVMNAAGASAGGAYQFMPATWNFAMQLAGLSTKTYPSAVKAPIPIQDGAATALVNYYLKKHGNKLDSVPGCWFAEAVYVTPSRWDIKIDDIVGGHANGKYTMRMYINQWLANYKKLGGGGGAAAVDEAAIQAGGIPTNVGGTQFASAGIGGGTVTGGIATNAGTVYASATPPGIIGGGSVATNTLPSGTVNASAMLPGQVNASATIPGMVYATAGGVAAVANEAEIARRRADGALSEERIKARRDQGNALAEYEVALAARESKASEIMAKEAEGRWTLEEKMKTLAEYELLTKNLGAAATKVSAAEEAKIAADRKAGVETEKTSWATRADGMTIEQEIARLRAESMDIAAKNEVVAGTNFVNAVNVAAHNFVDAGVVAGKYFTDAANVAAHDMSVPDIGKKANAGHDTSGITAKPFFDGIYTWFPDGTYVTGDITGKAPVYNGQQWTGQGWVPVATAVTGSGGGSSGVDISANQNALSKTTDQGITNGDARGIATDVVDAAAAAAAAAAAVKENETKDVQVLAPFIFQLDGKSLAEGLFEYTKTVIRRNGDFTSDGAWRVGRGKS